MSKQVISPEAAELLAKVADNLKALSDCIREASDYAPEEEKAEAAPEEKKPEITLELVRGFLAARSQDGHTAEVREIIRKHGAERLSEINPEDYADIMREAEELTK